MRLNIQALFALAGIAVGAVLLVAGQPFVVELLSFTWQAPQDAWAYSSSVALVLAAYVAVEVANKVRHVGRDKALKRFAVDYPNQRPVKDRLGEGRSKSAKEWLQGVAPQWQGADREELHGIVEAALARQVEHVVDKDMHLLLKIAIRLKGGRRATMHGYKYLSREFAAGRKVDPKEFLDGCRKLNPDLPVFVEELASGGRPMVLDLIDEMTRTRDVAVASTAEFGWLKDRDRTLWYALNNLGRSTWHVEGLGPIAHILEEQRTGIRSNAPMVRRAAVAVADRVAG